jgi:hypothetical protein
MRGTIEPDLRVSLLRLLKSDRMPSSANARSTLKSRVRRPGEYTQCLSRIDSRKPLWRVFTTWVLAPERVTGWRLPDASRILIFGMVPSGSVMSFGSPPQWIDAPLSMVKRPPRVLGSLSHEARQEYIRDPAARLYLQPNAGRGNPGDPPAGARSLSGVQAAFAAMWDAAVHDLAIHPRPKGKRQGGAGNSTRVDGHETDVYFEANAADAGVLFNYDPATGNIARAASARHMHSAFDIFLEHDHSVEELRDVFEAAMSSTPQGTMTREKICFRCFGIGHTENEDTRTGTKGCPSPKRTPGRDIGAYLLLISALAARQAAGGRRIPTDAMPSPSADAAAGDRPRRRSPEPKPRGRAGWWRKATRAARSAEEDETEEDGGEASADALAIDGGPSAKATDLARNDPFASTVEDEADWVEPYDAAEAATVPRTHARLPWPLRMAISAAKQWLVLVLWLWASPAMLVISSLRGTDALVAPSPAPLSSRIFVPGTHSRQLLALRPSQIAEETYWRARGYSVEYALNATAAWVSPPRERLTETSLITLTKRVNSAAHRGQYAVESPRSRHLQKQTPTEYSTQLTSLDRIVSFSGSTARPA